MELSYQCHSRSGMNPETWTGHIRLLQNTAPYEMKVNARGSCFHIVFGRYTYRNYISIPNWNIGTEISGLKDSFWNFEQLTSACPKLSPVDAISITNALATVSEYIDF